MPNDTFFNLPAEKRNKLTSVAVQAFAHAYYHDVSVDAIVNAAGIPKGSFYQYFQNKADMYRYLIRYADDAKIERLKAVFAAIGRLGFTEFLRTLFLEGARIDREQPALANLRNRFIFEGDDKMHKDLMEDSVRKSNELLADVLREYIKRGEVREDIDIELSAHIITVSTMTIIRYYLNGIDFNNEGAVMDVVDRMLSIIENGVKIRRE